MGGWFSKLMQFGRGDQPDPKRPVRVACQRALQGRYLITLESPQGIVACTTIMRMLGDELIVAQPTMSGMLFPLADDETFKMSFIEQDTNLSGQTRCLGRTKTQTRRGAAYVYRLALPTTLRFDDRRGEPRNQIDPRVAPRIEVTGSRLKGTLVGSLADISITGVRIHTKDSTDRIEISHELQVKFLMPDPAGLIDEVTEVHRIEIDEDSGMNAICVSFRRRIPRLEALLRMTTDRAPMPLEQMQRRVA